MSAIGKLFHVTPVGMAITGVAPIAFLWCIVAIQTLPRVVDPCVTWNFTGRVERFEHPCPGGRMGIPEGKFRFLLLSLGMPTVMLLVALLGIAGAYRSERRVVLAVSLLLFLITGPLMLGNFGLITLISAICFLLSAALTRR
jgi:hypothetical protein